jgi:hypothetical protein
MISTPDRQNAIALIDQELHAEARAANPTRWSRQIRSWSPIGNLCLNPERGTNGRKIRDAA